ncbi:MAG: DUF882 domain-containing protein [Deltaproteobacteria bacterium]|nr:DUF882 domain-containing protein [Deltaproteobacteria bacterium]
MKKFFLFLILAGMGSTIFFSAYASGEDALADNRPFFLMGDGRLQLRHLKTGQEIRVDLLNPNGSLNEAALLQIDALFGLSFAERGEHVSPRMLFMLDYFSDRAAPGKAILIHSGYRSPEYNEKLKKAGNIVANTSLHLDGMALDFSIEGVGGKDLWEEIRRENCCGVGHYGGEVLHLDAGRPRFWEAATAGVTTGQSDYNRRLYLSTEFDRYAPAQRVRLHLAAVSNFGFGVRPVAALVSDLGGEQTVARLEIQGPALAECLPMSDRKQTRFIYLNLPADLAPGRYRFRLDFCRRPFEQMPIQIISNAIEIR